MKGLGETEPSIHSSGGEKAIDGEAGFMEFGSPLTL